MLRVLQSFIALAGVILFVNASQLEAALDASQKQALATAENGLKQVEANLKLAQSAAGAGTAAIQGSKARLVQSRLAMAKTPLAQLNEIVAALPADDAQVAALKQRLDTANAAVAAIEARLNSKPAEPAPATSAPNQPQAKAPSAPAAGAPRLDYKQEQLAKDARSYLAEIEGLSGGAADVVKQIAPMTNQGNIDHNLVASAANSIAKARQRAGLVKGRLDQLPQNAQGVAELVAQYKEQMASLDASDKVIAPLHQKLSALVDPTLYPNLEADIRRVQQLALMYQSADVLSRNYEQAAALVGQLPAAETEAKRVATAYAPLVQQKTPAGERVEKMQQFFHENRATFSAAVAERKQTLPMEIDAHLAKAGQMADDAVAQQKPAFFSGGIPMMVSHAEQKMTLLAALDPAAATAAKAKIGATREQLKLKAASLADAIVAANPLPPDRYAGKDKAALTKLAAATWKQVEPNAEILAIRFPSDQWNRDAILRYENRSWRLIDRSKLQAQVVVKQDGKRAVIRPIDLWTDHVNNDKLSAIPMDGLQDELPPQRYLLIEKVR